MSSVSTSRTKKIDPLSKRTPQNPKYKNVRSTIDTGASITKFNEKLEEMRNNYKFRKDEIFKRMKATTFVHLVIQVYQIENDDFLPPDTPYTDADSVDAEIANAGRRSPVSNMAPGDYGAAGQVPDTARSTLLSVARGVGEMDLNGPPGGQPMAAAPVMDSSPYLLLDVRETDDYDNCHITGAVNYPKSYLSRATNYEIKIMHQYRNKPGKVIIVYDEDERIAPYAAQTLVQRGYDNLFMLSGGMKVAYKVFPDGLFTGTVPPTITGTKAREYQPACKDKFDQSDIDKLEVYLDGHLADNSVGSRLSKASTASSRYSNASSVATARSNVSTTSRPPFR